MSGRYIWKLTGTKAWRVFSLFLLLSMVCAGGWGLYLVQGMLDQNIYEIGRPADSKFLLKSDCESTLMSIPVRYLPFCSLENGPGTKKILKKDYGETVINVPSPEVALILVDTWNTHDPPVGGEPSELIKRTKDFLEKCRKNGVTIIYAPNRPVVDKYPQYKQLKMEVIDFLRKDSLSSRFSHLKDRRMGDYRKKVIYRWPPSDIYKKYNDIRKEGRAAAYEVYPGSQRDISRFLEPREDEIVLLKSDELRYVLWLRKIKVLLYVGGASNECMLHRDTGINRLSGIDPETSNYVIAVMADCTSTIPSPCSEDDTVDRVMMDYMMRKIAFVGDSTNVSWEKH